MKKKIFLIGIGIISLAYLINKNRKQAGIINNQKIYIDGLLREVKNLSYHLGKRNI